jgi:hypothetical protein
MAFLGRIFGVCAIALALGCTAGSGLPAGFGRPAPLAAEMPTFSSFWGAFRAAALAGNTDRLAAMTRFPLELKYELDSDPPGYATRASFGKELARAMDADTGLSVSRPQTNRALIEATRSLGTPQRGVSLSAVHARIGAFAFRKEADGWKLYRLYLPDEASR